MAPIALGGRRIGKMLGGRSEGEDGGQKETFGRKLAPNGVVLHSKDLNE